MGESPQALATEKLMRRSLLAVAALVLVAASTASAASSTIEARVDPANPRFGDTFAYVEADGAATKQAREEAAADRLFGLLPAETGRLFREMWDEYERGDTAEARFVMAIDRMAPMMLNLAEGASTWREHGITRSRVIARNGHHIEKSLPDAWSVVLAQLDAACEAGVVDPA